MTIVVFGGAGFVGLNVAERLLESGRDVVLADRTQPPPEASVAFAALGGRARSVVVDVTAADQVAAAVGGAEAIVYAAAITPDAAREAADASRILNVNLVGFQHVLTVARAHAVARIVNVSSAGAYGEAAFGAAPLDEASTMADPRTLYALTKFASERLAARLKDLWGLDVRSVRLSAVFGPWERATGVRDTLSPPFQVMRAALTGAPVRFERQDVRDWIYAPDVARAVEALLMHPAPTYDLYNVGPGVTWDVVDWACDLTTSFPDLDPSVDATKATIRSHMARARRPMRVERLERDLGAAAAFGREASAAHYAVWARAHSRVIIGGA